MTDSAHIVLPGCGTRFPYLIGAIKALELRGISPLTFTGTSGGALISSLAAAGYDSERMTELANKFLPKEVFSGGPLHMLFAGPMGGWFGGEKITKALKATLPSNFDDFKKPLFIVTHNISLGMPTIHCAAKYVPLIVPSPNYIIATDTPAYMAVRASMSIPLAFDAVKIKGHYHEDGGISANDFRDLLVPTTYSTIGFSFKASERRKTRQMATHADRAGYVIDDMINASAREHIEDAHWSQTVLINDSHSGFDRSMSSKDVSDMVSVGYRDTLNFFRKKLAHSQR